MLMMIIFMAIMDQPGNNWTINMIKGAKYAIKLTKKGPVRLAWKNNKVVEAKNLKTGAFHSQADFKADAKRRKK